MSFAAIIWSSPSIFPYTDRFNRVPSSFFKQQLQPQAVQIAITATVWRVGSAGHAFLCSLLIFSKGTCYRSVSTKFKESRQMFGSRPRHWQHASASLCHRSPSVMSVRRSYCVSRTDASGYIVRIHWLPPLYWDTKPRSNEMSSKELSGSQAAQYVGPYRLEKTLGKGQTGKSISSLGY